MRRHSALVVVDLQRDFCPGGPLPVAGCTRIVPVVNQYLVDAQALSMWIYASRLWCPATARHFTTSGGPWPPHCVQGTPGAAFHPALELPADVIVVTRGDDPNRPALSAFDGHTPTGERLLDDVRGRGVLTLFVAGIATEYSVRRTAMDALHAGLRVVLLTDAMAGVDERPGDADRALRGMIAAGAVPATGLPPADVVLLCVEWRSRIALRAQLIEDGVDVAATDTWPMMRRYLRPGQKPILVVVDLMDLPEATQVLDELRMLMAPSHVLVLGAMSTISSSDLERLGFRVLHRPLTVEDVASAVRRSLRPRADGIQHAP